MTHGSLFSGIGGFDLAAQWMGWENVFHCEIAEFPRKVLHHYWPNAISYENIKETDFKCHRGRIDVISGGFPCQPYSLAGKRLGKEDDRHLWPEMLRCIREIQPKWVVGENVLGIVNWSGGLVFDEVQSDLEAEGYEVQTFVLPACAVNAPHRRDRVWFVAKNTNRDGWASNFGQKESSERQFWNSCSGNNEPVPSNDSEIGLTPDPDNSGIERRQRVGGIQQEAIRESEQTESFGTFGENGFAPDPNSERHEECDTSSITIQQRRQQYSEKYSASAAGHWENFPTTQPTIRRGDDGLSSRLDGITFSKWRNESIKAYGNAVVPQVVYEIFKAIEEWENKY